MHAASKHEKFITGIKIGSHLQTRIYYDSELTKMRLKFRYSYLCVGDYSPWLYIDVEDIFPSKNFDNE